MTINCGRLFSYLFTIYYAWAHRRSVKIYKTLCFIYNCNPLRMGDRLYWLFIISTRMPIINLQSKLR